MKKMDPGRRTGKAEQTYMKNNIFGKTEKVIALALAVYGLILLVRILGTAAGSAAYPNEYREAANIAMTRSILSGENIYSLSANAGRTPAVCYLYGPLMSVFAAALSFLLPFLPLQVIHYLISFASMIGSALLMALMVKRYTRSMAGSVAAFVLGLFCHWRYGYVYGAPDSFGLFIMTAVLYLLLCGVERESERKDQKNNLYIEAAAALTLASFFTKQYYLMVAGVGALYLLLVSRRLFLRYAVSGIAMTAIVFLFLIKRCPLYFTYAIYFLKGPGPGAAMGKTGKAYNSSQVMYLGGLFITLFIAAAGLVIYMLWCFAGAARRTGIRTAAAEMFSVNGKRSLAADSAAGQKSGDRTTGAAGMKAKDHTGGTVIKDAGQTGADVRMDVFSDKNYLLLFLSQGAVSALVLRYIGNNDGAFLSYYLQLFTPALIALSVYALELFLELTKNKLPWLLIPAWLIFMGYTLFRVEPRLVIGAMTREEVACWEEAYATLDEYRDKGEICYCPLLNYYGYEKGDQIYNDGQPFVFTEKFLNSYNESEAAKALFPDAGRVIAGHLSYREELREKVKAGGYELVARIPDMDVFFTDEELEMNYEKLKTLELRAGSWAWDMELWVRK